MCAVAQRRKHRSGNPLNLLDLLINNTSHLECSNARDRIHGFMSIRGVREINLPRIDYTNSTSHVFRTTARALIKGTGKLGIFAASTCIRVLANLPSWVLGWSLAYDEGRIEFLDISQFCASRQHKHQDRCPRNYNELIVFGRSVDFIDGVIEHAFDSYPTADLHQHLPLQKLALLYYIYLFLRDSSQPLDFQHLSRP